MTTRATKTAQKTARKRSTAAGKTAGTSASRARKSAAKTAIKAVTAKPAKPNLVRDSFTIPEGEYQLLTETKKACVKAGIEIKKSELIRIGIGLVHALGVGRLKKAQQSLQPVKAGRPKKHK